MNSGLSEQLMIFIDLKSIFDTIFEMNNQSEGDLRKSKRQRVPNSFYMQAVAELKRLPLKSTKQTVPKPQNKKQPIFHDSSQNSQLGGQDKQVYDAVVDEDREWYTCRLPKTGQFLNVQFIVQRNQELTVQKKKQETAKNHKKVETSFDLLSLFQEAIKNVNRETVDRPVEFHCVHDQQPIKTQRPIKQIRKHDSQGVIKSVRCQAGKTVFCQSILGQVEVELMQNEVTQEMDHSFIDDLRQKIQCTHVFAQLPVFDSQD